MHCTGRSTPRSVRGALRVAGPASLALALALTGLPVRQAAAQTDAQNKAAARALGIEGIKLANAGDCEQAIDKLQRAEQLYHAPTILGRLGECQVELGQLVVGTENLYRVVREPLGADAPAAFLQAQDRAKRVLDLALPRIAKLTVQVAAPADAEVVVTVDGQALPPAMLGVERPIDPGEHALSLSAPGYQQTDQRVVLPEGGTETVTLQLGPATATAAAAETVTQQPEPVAAPPPAPQDTGVAEQPEARPPLLGYVSLGVGAVGLGVGSVFGLMATGKKSDLAKVCDEGRCPPMAQDDIDDMNTYATISTVGFSVGIVGVGVGVALLLSGSGSGPEALPQTAQAPSLRVHPWIGPHSAGVQGVF
jgi:hypothetical protein